MTQLFKAARFTATLALASLGGTSSFAAEQPSPAEAAQAADAAEQIVNEANSAIRAIDPTTGEPSLIVDPSLPEPYGPTLAPGEAEIPSVDELPELPPVEAITSETSAEVAEPPRGPAARMIAQPVVQSVPAPAPTPIATPAPAVATAQEIAQTDPFRVNSILSIPPGPFRYGDWYWDESNAPKKGKLVMTVDLEARVISVFRDGHEIGTAVALLGTKKHPTPLGTFPILTKEKDNISEKYNNAPMPWTLRLTWDGIAIHGSPVINGYASHGCIGVPDPFAEKLFAAARRGDRVVITRGQMIGVGDKITS